MAPVKNIIFDYGNVIFTINFDQVRKAWMALGVTDIDSFYGHKNQNKLFDDFEKGMITRAEFREQVRVKTANPPLTNEQIDTAWNSIFVEVPQGNHELLLKLKSRYRTFLLSNTNAIHFDYFSGYLKREFGFETNDHLFEKVYYSHLVGKRKPDADIFEQVMYENNLDPAETLFIDDSPQHLATARKLGWQTFLMTAPDTIQAFVEREGLLES